MEQVSWSAYLDCEHVFHHECIREWLLHHTDCPCCRQTFLSIDRDDSVLMKETMTTLFQQVNQRQKAMDYCLQHGCVPHIRHLKAKKKFMTKGVGTGVRTNMNRETLEDTTSGAVVTETELVQGSMEVTADIQQY